MPPLVLAVRGGRATADGSARFTAEVDFERGDGFVGRAFNFVVLDVRLPVDRIWGYNM